MANSYYAAASTFTKNTLGRAEAVTAETTALVAAFDKVPPQVALEQDRVAYALDSGVADAYVVTMPQTWASYVTGSSLVMKIVNANTGPSTINVDSIGVVSITRLDGSALAAGELPAGGMIRLAYNGTNFQTPT